MTTNLVLAKMGNVYHEEMLRLGLNLQDVAARGNLTASTVSDFIYGRKIRFPLVSTQRALQNAVGFPETWFIDQRIYFEESLRSEARRRQDSTRPGSLTMTEREQLGRVAAMLADAAAILQQIANNAPPPPEPPR